MDSPHHNAVAVPFALQPAAQARRSRTASVNTKATILIVDDEPDVREVLEEYFVTHGYAAMCAESADAAKAIAAAHPIDLALVDINMPGEDGLSLARHLRERYAKMMGDGAWSGREVFRLSDAQEVSAFLAQAY